MDFKQRAAATSLVEHIEKLYMENTLLRVAGALFCHDPKRASTRTKTIELNNGVAEKHIVIRPTHKWDSPVRLPTRYSSRSSKNIPTMAARSKSKSPSPSARSCAW